MKKSQLKQLLKPIVKECINEALTEQGLLSNIISEVVKGLQPTQTIVEAKRQTTPQIDQQAIDAKRMEMLEEQQRALKEQKRKLLDATGLGADIFEGTAPLASAGTPDSAPGAAAALSGVDPTDAGVDISGLLALSGKQWNKIN